MNGERQLTQREPSPRVRLEQYLVVIIGLGVLALLGFRILEAHASSGRRMGFAISAEEGPLEVESTDSGSPAERAGFLSGDVLVQMNGQPLEELADYDLIAADFVRGGTVDFVIQRRGQRQELTAQPGMSFPFLEFAILAPALLAFLALGLLALSQRGRHLPSRLLALLSIAVAIELVLPLDAIGSPVLDITSFAILLFLTGLQMGLELHLVTVIPEAPSWLLRRPWLAAGYYLIGFGFAMPAFLAWIFESLGVFTLPWSFEKSIALLFGFGLTLWAIAVVWLLGRTALRHPDSLGRHQAGLVLAGLLPWALLVLTTAVMTLAEVPVPEWVGTIEPLVLLCLPLAAFSAIFRYHLFDLEMVVRRSLVYTVLTALLVLIFYLLVGAGGVLLSQMAVGASQIWAISAATLLMGLLFSPLRDAVHRGIDRHFFRERVALRQELVKLAAALPALGTLPAMSSELARQLSWAFGVRSVTLLITNPESNVLSTQASFSLEQGDGGSGILLSTVEPGIETLRRARRPLSLSQLRGTDPRLTKRLKLLGVDLVVPIERQDELVGLILMGGKVEEKNYVAEELELLNLFSHHVATVFENARLFESATRDGLTGLLRRGPLLKELDRELRRALRFDRPITVAMIDLDHFKQVNDEHGHLVGDLLLRRVATILSEGLRSSDLIGRFGGEEFLVVLPETDLEGALKGADKIRSLVEEFEAQLDTGKVARMTISVGLAGLDSLEVAVEPTSADLIASADRQLYLAKHRGRNRVEPHLTTDSGRHLAMVTT